MNTHIPLTGRALEAKRELEQVRAEIEAQEARTLDPKQLKLTPQRAAELLGLIRIYGARSFERALCTRAVKSGGGTGRVRR